MRRSFGFPLRPAVHRQVAPTACLDDHRALRNAALEHRRTAYRRAGVSITYGLRSADLKHIRAADADGQGRWSFSSRQATLRRLDKAFAAFFARVEAGRAPGFPRFKGKGRFDAVTWPKDGDGRRWDSQPEHPSATFVRLQGIGHVRVHRHRPVRGTVKTLSVKREGHRWYVILSCEDVPAEPLPATGAVVGIDLGVASLVTTSDGGHLDDPCHLPASAGRELIAVNPANTSRTCAACGHVAKENRPTQAGFHCQRRAHTAHADVNAAINILRAGLALRDVAQAAQREAAPLRERRSHQAVTPPCG